MVAAHLEHALVRGLDLGQRGPVDALAIQLVWVIIMWLLGRLVLNQAVRKVVVQGG